MQGLLCASFGTSYEQARIDTLDAMEDCLKAAFPDRAFYSAWTSKRIVAKVLASRGEHHDSLSEALDRASADGVTDLVVASMYLMPGQEWNRASEATNAWAQGESGRAARITPPLLGIEQGRRAIAQAVCDEFASLPDDEALVLMGHGSRVSSNEVYSSLRDEFRALGRPLFYVATVEGDLAFDGVVKDIESQGVKRVFLAPLMIVAGDHANNDLAGDDETSWKNVLQARNVQAEPVLKGLGEYEGVRKLICDFAADAALQMQGGADGAC